MRWSHRVRPHAEGIARGQRAGWDRMRRLRISSDCDPFVEVHVGGAYVSDSESVRSVSRVHDCGAISSRRVPAKKRLKNKGNEMTWKMTWHSGFLALTPLFPRARPPHSHWRAHHNANDEPRGKAARRGGGKGKRPVNVGDVRACARRARSNGGGQGCTWRSNSNARLTSRLSTIGTSSNIFFGKYDLVRRSGRANYSG